MRLSGRELLILFLVGAAGGLVGDAGHVQAGTTTYLDDATPFVWESALWFPVLVGLATASLGELRLRLGPPRPGFDIRIALAAIAAVVALYALTAIVYDEFTIKYDYQNTNLVAGNADCFWYFSQTTTTP